MPPELDMVLRLLLATALGAIIGYQRERAGKEAGLRTIVLICVGAALFTITSIYAFGAEADPSRVAAGIVAGVGFLGAGAIIRRGEGMVAGLTTAATIWAAAGIGMAAGAGFYLIAAVATAIILIILLLPHPIS
ncbi:MAG TPA: MgtC/SapB family protein [Dehalococcoidales bacterium]|nr:MgtC/SapB family protein [Dehalococcoidales bacterium]